MGVDREDNDQQQRQPEVRDGDPETRADGDHPVARRAVADPGDDARRDTDEDRQEHAADGEIEGDRKACGNAGGNRLARVEERGPEVAVDEPVQPAQILPPEGFVQMQLLRYLRHFCGIGVHPACECQRRVPGQDEHEAEDREGDQQQKGDCDQ